MSLLSLQRCTKIGYRFLSKKIAQISGNIIKMPPVENLAFKPDLKGLGNAYFESMKKHKSKVCQIDDKTGETKTYESLLQRCIRTAIHLQNRCVKENDYLCVCSLNTYNNCVPYFAATFIGAKFTYLDPRLPLVVAMHIIKNIQPKVLFVHEDTLKQIEDAVHQSGVKGQIVVYGKSDKYDNFNEFLKPTLEETTFKPFQVDDVHDMCLTFFTSGTTGLPKGVCLSHYTVMAQAFLIYSTRLKKMDVNLYYTTPYWVSGVICLTLDIIEGTSFVVTKLFDINTFWKTIEKYKVNFLFAPTMHTTLIYKFGLPKGIDISSLVEFAIGGSSLSDDIMNGLRKMLPSHVELKPCYGQTEAGGCALSLYTKDREILDLAIRKPLSSGIPMYGYSYKVVDLASGKLLGPNQQGELWIKSKLIAKNYLFPAKSAVDSEGWLKTEDIVYYDEDLFFYVIDRIGDIYKVKNFFIAPTFIEHKIEEHPSVQLAAVVPLPNKEDISHSFAFVILKKHAKAVSAQEIIEFVEKSMDEKFHLKGGCKIVDSLPTTPTEKVNRRKLLRMLLADTEAIVKFSRNK